VKKMTSTSFNEILFRVLKAENKPLDIFMLVDKALKIKRIKKDRYLIGQEFYKLANKEDSPFLVEEYPSFKLRSFTKSPRLPKRGYISSAFKILSSSRKYIELREMVQRATHQGLLKTVSKVPEYWMYAQLRDHVNVFSQKGTLKVILKDWNIKEKRLRSQGKRLPWKESRYTTDIESLGGLTTNIHEANLESIIIENLNKIEEGLQLIQRQYSLPIGRIDILCKDRKGNYVVIELKKFGAKTYSIIDQISRYLGYIKTHVAKLNQRVRGIIIVAKADENLNYAVKGHPDIEVKIFNLSISPME
jgi:hypothetical protein